MEKTDAERKAAKKAYDIEYRKKNKDKLNASSKIRLKKWRQDNPEKYIQTRDTWYSANKRRHKDVILKRKFGISIEDYERMHEEQNGLCAICNLPESAVRYGEPISLHIDHCHKTNRVRKLLCGNCNRGIGLFKDSADLLTEAAKYVNQF